MVTLDTDAPVVSLSRVLDADNSLYDAGFNVTSTATVSISVNGVKLTFEECETGYATDKGVECYERLKGKNATLFDPQATGITFALTDKVPADKIKKIALRNAASNGATLEFVRPEGKGSWTSPTPPDGFGALRQTAGHNFGRDFQFCGQQAE